MSAPTLTRTTERRPLTASGGEPLRERLFRWMLLACLSVGVVTLVVLLSYIVIRGWPRLDAQLITNMPSQVLPATAGAQSAIAGTLWLMFFTALWTIPTGIAAAIYLAVGVLPGARGGKWNDWPVVRALLGRGFLFMIGVLLMLASKRLALLILSQLGEPHELGLFYGLQRLTEVLTEIGLAVRQAVVDRLRDPALVLRHLVARHVEDFCRGLGVDVDPIAERGAELRVA